MTYSKFEDPCYIREEVLGRMPPPRFGGGSQNPAPCLCVNACDNVCSSISVTQNDQLKCETKVDSIVMLYHLGFKTIFIKQKCYRTYMWHLNKVWSANFVDDNEILAEEKQCY